MKRIDFEHGTVTGNILGAALPMLVAQILSSAVQYCRPRLHRADPGGRNGGTRCSRSVFSADRYHHSIQQLVWKRRRSAVFD